MIVTADQARRKGFMGSHFSFQTTGTSCLITTAGIASAREGLGQADLNKIEILGPALKDHIKIHKLPANMERLLSWQKPLKEA
jgi:hypothetical protein